MRHLRLFIFIAICLFSFTSFTAPGKKEDMKLHLLKGEQYTYVINQESAIQENPNEMAALNQKIGMKIRQDVKDKLDNGNYLIEATILNFNLEMKFKGKVSRYDSDTVNVMNKYYKSLNFLTLHKFNYEVSQEGVVSKLSGFDPIKKKIEDDPQVSSLLRSFGSERFLLEFYNYIPLKSVAAKDQWIASGILPDMMNVKYDLHYSIKEALAQGIQLKLSASFANSIDTPMQEGKKSNKIKETGTQNGTLLIDPQTHMCLSSNVDQLILIKETNPENPEKDRKDPIKVITNTKRLLIKK